MHFPNLITIYLHLIKNESMSFQTRRLRCITRNMEQDDKIHNQMIAKVLIKMLEIDGKSTKLQCLNVQRNQFSIKYMYIQERLLYNMLVYLISLDLIHCLNVQYYFCYHLIYTCIRKKRGGHGK